MGFESQILAKDDGLDSTKVDLASELWDQAYDELKIHHGDTVLLYESILFSIAEVAIAGRSSDPIIAGLNGKPCNNPATQKDNGFRRHQMHTWLAERLDKIKRSQASRDTSLESPIETYYSQSSASESNDSTYKSPVAILDYADPSGRENSDV
ncbi:hypothetical protein MKX08_007319 [Trichoderma sp. CBMAI-0020]|nr:hypothetical protein MKX08_007319 [Trichoderma sp. CBMAI-0020]